MVRVALFSIFWVFCAQATTIQIDSIETMAQKSELIVRARVTDRESMLKNGRIITYSTLKVLEHLKGKSDKEIRVYQVGGSLNGRVLKIMGAHSYRLGEEIIFMGLPHRGNYVSYGISLGKFNVTKNGFAIEEFQDVEVALSNMIGPREKYPRRILLKDLVKRIHKAIQ